MKKGFYGLTTQPQILLALQKKKKAARGRKIFLKPPRIIYPRPIERRYQHDLRIRLKRLWKILQERLLPRLESLANKAAQELGRPKHDAASDDLQQIIGGIRVEFGRVLPQDEVKRLAKFRAKNVSDFNRAQQDKVFKTVLDVDVFHSEPYLEPQFESFAVENVRLISSVEDDLLDQIQGLVTRAFQTGSSIKDLSSDIRDRFDVANSRADLIARDQIGKLNGQLSEIRQNNLGVRRFVWRTALDERVRPEHALREGEVYDWDDPPDGEIPGYPINCRCIAEPVIEDLLDDNSGSGLDES